MNSKYLFDPVRRREVLATPEELVRQAILKYLIESLHVPVNLIGVEFSLSAIEPGNFNRADIVVYEPGQNQLKPWLLVECKAPQVPIDEEVAFQAAGYLKKIPSKFVMLSNGKTNQYLQWDLQAKKYIGVLSLPFFSK